MSLFPGEAALLRAASAEAAFPHTFVRTPYSRPGAEDSEGNAQPVPTVPEPDLPCRFRAQATLRSDTGGRTLVNVPNLVLPFDARLEVGDLVSDVVDGEGRVLLAGPTRVETIAPSAAFGPTLGIVAFLRGAEVR